MNSGTLNTQKTTVKRGGLLLKGVVLQSFGCIRRHAKELGDPLHFLSFDSYDFSLRFYIHELNATLIGFLFTLAVFS